jgi:hypothetical protein
MDDTKLFAQDCADFFKKKMFTRNVKPDVLARRIDVALYLITQNLLSGLPSVPGVGKYVMSTKGGGGGPHHLVELLHYLKNRGLTKKFFSNISGL